jgi:hypothetical protein
MSIRYKVMTGATLVACLCFLATMGAGAGSGGGKTFPPPQRVLVTDGSPVQNVGNLLVHIPNWGILGSMPTTSLPFHTAPSAEWPAGSGIEYLYVAGLWIGAMKGGVPAVSTAAFEFEFRPTADPIDVVYYAAEGDPGGNRVPDPNADDDHDGTIDEEWLDGHDNDSDGAIDEDYAAISDQMLSSWYVDDDTAAVNAYPQHNPLHVRVRQNSYQWSDPDFDDFVGIEYTITNIGDEVLEDIFLGMFVDGDVGNRNTPNYWEDDGSGFMSVTGVNSPWGTADVEFGYVYDFDGDMGQAPGYCGVLLLDHTTDDTGTTAPTEAHWVTYATFAGNQSYEDGGDPTNDFERYEVMSSETIERSADIPRDYRTLLAAGPFPELAPGETLTFRLALFAGDRANNLEEVLRNAAAAKLTYEGEWLDLDGDPNTGVDGKEYQKHWVLPTDIPVPVMVNAFDVRTSGSSAVLSWEIFADEPVRGFKLLRSDAAGGVATLPSQQALLPPETRTYTDAGVSPGGDYRYTLVAVLADGTERVSRTVETSIPSAATELHQNIPNPFNPTTTIAFTLARRQAVTLSVYTPDGKLVTTLVDGIREAGRNEVSWNGTDSRGNAVRSGIYLYRLEAGNTAVSRKMLLMK